MENRIVIQTKTVAKDYKALVFFSLYRRHQFFPYFIIIVAVLALGAVIGRIAGVIPIADWYYNLCLGFWGLIALNYFIYLFTVKRFLASDKFMIGREYTVTIDETGITSKDEKAGDFASYQWDKFYKAYETKKYFFLYLNTAMALVFAKNDFRSEDIPVLENLIRDNMGSKFKKR
jgi:hypothetical protein